MFLSFMYVSRKLLIRRRTSEGMPKNVFLSDLSGIPGVPVRSRASERRSAWCVVDSWRRGVCICCNSTTIPGDEGISVYRPERFVLNHEHQASALYLDAFFGSGSSPQPGRLRGGPRLYDGLGRSPFATWFPGGKAPESTTGTSPGRVRASSSATVADGTPFGGLRCLDDLIIFHRPGVSPPNPLFRKPFYYLILSLVAIGRGS